MMQAASSFGVSAETEDGVCVITVVGEIDLATAPQVRSALVTAEAGEAPVIRLALSRVTFIDSTGIAVLVDHAERSRANGDRLRIVSGPAVDRVLEITGVSERLPIDRWPTSCAQPFQDRAAEGQRVDAPQGWARSSLSGEGRPGV